MKNNTSFKTTKHDYLFKGLLFCGDCGAKLYMTYSSYAAKKYNEYRYKTICYTHSKYYNHCTRHSNDILELQEVLLKSIKEICSKVIDEKLYSELLELGKRKKSNSTETKEELLNENKELEAKIESNNECIRNLYRDKVSKIIDDEDYQSMYQGFKEESQKLNKQLEANLKILKNLKVSKDRTEEIKILANKVLGMEEPTKELLSDLVSKVTITEDKKITIHFKFNELNSIMDITKK